jgi:hypothetical protein
VPFLLSLLSGLVSSTVIKALVTRAVVALGFAAVTYTGISLTFNAIVANINSNASSLPAGVWAIVSIAHIPQAFNVVLSAFMGALVLRGLGAAGAVTKVGISSAPGAVFSPGTF